MTNIENTANNSAFTHEKKNSSDSGGAFLMFNILTLVYFVMLYFSRKVYHSDKESSDGSSEGNMTFIYSLCYRTCYN